MMNKCDGCKYESTHQEMGFKPFGVCTLKSNLIEAQKAYNAEKCPYIGKKIDVYEWFKR